MRILYLTHQYFPRHIGGTEIYTRGLARRAGEAGHDILILTYHELADTDEGVQGIHRTEHDGIALSEMHFNLATSPDPARYEYDNPDVGTWVRAEVERFKPDLVHAMHVMKLSVAALEACYALAVPVVVALCDFWFLCPRHTLLRWDGAPCQGPRPRGHCLKCTNDSHGFAEASWVRGLPAWLLPAVVRVGLLVRGGSRARFWRDVGAIGKRPRKTREALLSANRIIALSSFQKAMFVRNGFPEDRIEVCRHGIEVSTLQGVEKTHGSRLRLLFIGSIVFHKGLHVLLDALGRTRDLAVDCLVYGAFKQNDEYADQIRQRVRQDSRVQLRGTYPREDEGRVLAEADVLVMPALWYENEPLVVKAALYMSIPVMASDIGSLPAMIEHGRNGWLVSPGRVQAWADRLGTLEQDIGRLTGAPPSVKSMNQNAAEMFEIYRDLANSGV